MADYTAESSLRGLAANSHPYEFEAWRRLTAYDVTPVNLRELQGEIARATDPKTREILTAEYERLTGRAPPLGEPPVTSAAPLDVGSNRFAKYRDVQDEPDPTAGEAPNRFAKYAPGYVPPPEVSDVGRGFKTAIGQTPALLKGTVGLIGATAENLLGEGGVSTAVKDWGLRGYAEAMGKLQPLQRETDSLTTAWERAQTGDVGALVDWAQYGLGYAAGQIGESALAALVGGGVGGLALKGVATKAVGGMVTKEAAKLAAEQAAAKAAGQKITELGAAELTKIATRNVARTIGTGAALGAFGAVQELGSIYPDAEEVAKKERRQLDGGDLARVWGMGLAAGGIEALSDKLGLDLVAGKVPLPGVGGRAARGLIGGAAVGAGEGLTEAVQTGMEQYGAGREVGTDESIREIIDAAGLGAIGGGAVGGAAGAFNARAAQEAADAKRKADEARAAADLKKVIEAPDVDSAILAAQRMASGTASVNETDAEARARTEAQRLLASRHATAAPPGWETPEQALARTEAQRTAVGDALRASTETNEQALARAAADRRRIGQALERPAPFANLDTDTDPEADPRLRAMRGQLDQQAAEFEQIDRTTNQPVGGQRRLTDPETVARLSAGLGQSGPQQPPPPGVPAVGTGRAQRPQDVPRPAEMRDGWIDLTPQRNEREARTHLAQLRERAPEFGVNPNNMVLAPHPTEQGAMAVRALRGDPFARATPPAPVAPGERDTAEIGRTTPGKTVPRYVRARTAEGKKGEQWADLSVMTAQQARERLAQLRAERQAQGGDPASLVAVRHPGQQFVGLKAGAQGPRAPAFAIKSLDRYTPLRRDVSNPDVSRETRDVTGDGTLALPERQPGYPYVEQYIERLRATNTPAAQAFVRDFDAGRVSRDDVMQRAVIGDLFNDKRDRALADTAGLTYDKPPPEAGAPPLSDRQARIAAATPAPDVEAAVKRAADRRVVFDYGEEGAAAMKMSRSVVKFASGLSSIRDLEAGTKGAAQQRLKGVGVVARDLSKSAIDTLAGAIVNQNVPVFVDSGAFSDFKSGKPAQDFMKLLAKYEEILSAIERVNNDYGVDPADVTDTPSDENAPRNDAYPRPYFVMPDVVGDQAGSLSLIKAYRQWIRSEAKGNLSRVIIPIQAGEQPLADVYRELVKTLGTDNFVVGIPSNAEAIKPAEFEQFLKDAKPRAVHILGAAAEAKLLPRLQSVIRAAPDTVVTADASPVRSKVIPDSAEGVPRGDSVQGAATNVTDPGTAGEREAAGRADDDQRYDFWSGPDKTLRMSDYTRKEEPPKKEGGKPRSIYTDKAGPFISLKDAEAKLDAWRAETRRQDKGDNDNGRWTVVSLFDASGEWAKPWAEAGYQVVTFDLQTGQDLAEFDAETFTADWGLYDVYAVIAAPPCTDFTVAGNRHWTAKDESGATAKSVHLVKQVQRTVDLFTPAVWALENPFVTRLKEVANLPKAAVQFDPYVFGDPYTKTTGLWGSFNTNMPTARVVPTEGSRAANLSSSDKYTRSLTPEGFAYSFFMANNRVTMEKAELLAREFKGMRVGFFRELLAEGFTYEAVREATENSFDGLYEGAPLDEAQSSEDAIRAELGEAPAPATPLDQAPEGGDAWAWRDEAPESTRTPQEREGSVEFQAARMLDRFYSGQISAQALRDWAVERGLLDDVLTAAGIKREPGDTPTPRPGMPTRDERAPFGQRADEVPRSFTGQTTGKGESRAVKPTLKDIRQRVLDILDDANALEIEKDAARELVRKLDAGEITPQRFVAEARASGIQVGLRPKIAEPTVPEGTVPTPEPGDGGTAPDFDATPTGTGGEWDTGDMQAPPADRTAFVALAPVTNPALPADKAQYGDNKSLRKAVHDHDLKAVLVELAKSKNPAVRRMTALSQALLGQVRIIPPPNEPKWGEFGNVAGAYWPARDAFAIGRRFGGSEWTVAHELMHALLYRTIEYPKTDEQKAIVKNMTLLMRHVQKNIQAPTTPDYDYGINWLYPNRKPKYTERDQLHEFLSESWTNPWLQWRLSNMPYQGSSVLSAFIRFLARLFGIKQHTALTEVMNLGETLALTGRAQPPVNVRRKAVVNSGVAYTGRREQAQTRSETPADAQLGGVLGREAQGTVAAAARSPDAGYTPGGPGEAPGTRAAAPAGGVRGAGGTVQRRARTVGLGIAERIERAETVSLIGEVADTPAKLAELAQVFRDPRYETFRVFLTKGDTIVGAWGVSTRAPGSAPMVPTGMTEAEYYAQFKSWMSQTGADGYYVLHNHPSGDPKPSRADADITLKLATAVPGFREHVVINSNKFAVIAMTSDAKLYGRATDLQASIVEKDFGPDELLKASKPLNVLGTNITRTSELATVAKSLQKPGWITLIGTSANGDVRVVSEAPSRILTRSDRYLTAMVRRLMRQSGSLSVFAVGSNADINSRPITEAIRNRVLEDAIPEVGQSLRASGVDPMPAPEGKGRNISDSGRANVVMEPAKPVSQANRSAETQATIELRKRAAVLTRLLGCLQ